MSKQNTISEIIQRILGVLRWLLGNEGHANEATSERARVEQIKEEGTHRLCIGGRDYKYSSTDHGPATPTETLAFLVLPMWAPTPIRFVATSTGDFFVFEAGGEYVVVEDYVAQYGPVGFGEDPDEAWWDLADALSDA